ncbi:MAG: hypothetical protein JNJ82_16260 [Opitutaceae bacterium]|nr:hypothetical protein [Opitutaceae bacterium]
MAAVALAVGGCRTTAIKAVLEPQWRFSDSATAMWRFRMDGVAYVFTGGIPGAVTDVKKVTPFFLVPADLLDSKQLLLRLEPDEASVRVDGVAFTEHEGLTVSEPRIYRFIHRADGKWSLVEISEILPTAATRTQVLEILSARLNRKIEKTPNRTQPYGVRQL